MSFPILTGHAIQKFRSSAVLREGLAAELEGPGISQALEAIKASVADFKTPDPVPGLHPDSVIAREYCTKRGIVQALQTLQAMCTATGTHELDKATQVPAQFETTMDERFRDPQPPGAKK